MTKKIAGIAFWLGFIGILCFFAYTALKISISQDIRNSKTEMLRPR